MTEKFTIPPEVLFQEVSGEYVLLDLGTEQYFGLNAVGSRIWQLLKEGLDQAHIVERLADEYEVARDTLEVDVSELLEQLAGAGLIRME